MGHGIAAPGDEINRLRKQLRLEMDAAAELRNELRELREASQMNTLRLLQAERDKAGRNLTDLRDELQATRESLARSAYVRDRASVYAGSVHDGGGSMIGGDRPQYRRVSTDSGRYSQVSEVHTSAQSLGYSHSSAGRSESVSRGNLGRDEVERGGPRELHLGGPREARHRLSVGDLSTDG